MIRKRVAVADIAVIGTNAAKSASQTNLNDELQIILNMPTLE
ncbi:hypothetical protein [Nostoc sp. PA-18-2419]|nr:hypothetical protein [Nostoc sp. PA-18-2419]